MMINRKRILPSRQAKKIMTPTQQGPEPLERKTRVKILVSGDDISDSESETESKSESESEGSGFSGEESEIPKNSANLKELTLDPGVVIKEEPPDPDPDHEENTIINETPNSSKNGVPTAGDDKNAKADAPFNFKIIKSENSADSSTTNKKGCGNGEKAATWSTPTFTIKAVIHELVTQHPSKQRTAKAKVRKKQEENKQDNSSPPRPRPGNAPPSKKSKFPKKFLSCPVCKIQLQRGQLSGHLLTKHKEVDKPFSSL